MINHSLRIDLSTHIFRFLAPFVRAPTTQCHRPEPRNHITQSSASRLSAQSTHTARDSCAQSALATTPVDVFFALLSLVPKRLTAAFTAQDGEVPSVGEVGKRRHRIILRVRPCVSWPTLDRCHGHRTAHTNATVASTSPHTKENISPSRWTQNKALHASTPHREQELVLASDFPRTATPV